ncbi:MAG: hypothetical protein ABR541_06755 [Candidatus Dormibacteria bacterium]
MPGFRRAQLRGSEELFRQTEAGADDAERDPLAPHGHGPQAQTELSVAAARRGDAVAVPAPSLDGFLVRLSQEDVQAIVDAIQAVKFPHKTVGRPSVDEFERLEELRQKLLSIL